MFFFVHSLCIISRKIKTFYAMSDLFDTIPPCLPRTSRLSNYVLHWIQSTTHIQTITVYLPNHRLVGPDPNNSLMTAIFFCEIKPIYLITYVIMIISVPSSISNKRRKLRIQNQDNKLIRRLAAYPSEVCGTHWLPLRSSW